MEYTISQTLHDCLVGFSMILSVCSIWLITNLALKSYFNRQALLDECKELFKNGKND